MNNKEVMVLPLSPRGLDFSFFMGFFFRAMAHVLVCPWIYILFVNFLSDFFWASWCALGCKELSLKLQDCAIMLSLL